MNIFNRSKTSNGAAKARPAELQLAPLPLAATTGANKVPTLVVYVIDSALTHSHECTHAHSLLDVIEHDPPDPNAPPTKQLGEFMRTEITQCAPLAAFKNMLTATFVEEWTTFGEKAALAERQYGIQPCDGTINAVTSAALIGATVRLDDPVEAFLAQHLVRRAYALCRAADDGLSGSVVQPSGSSIDERLYLLSQSAQSAEAVGRWLEHSMLEIDERAELEELLLGTADHIEFVAIAHTANRMIWELGERHHT
jgi:hypothetical protein